jgi:hypothetical protein
MRQGKQNSGEEQAAHGKNRPRTAFALHSRDHQKRLDDFGYKGLRQFQSGKLCWIASSESPRSKEYTTESSETLVPATSSRCSASMYSLVIRLSRIQCRTAIKRSFSQVPTMPNTMPTLCISASGPILALAAQTVAAEERVTPGRNT